VLLKAHFSISGGSYVGDALPSFQQSNSKRYPYYGIVSAISFAFLLVILLLK
jgi:hypothetical protein